MLGDEPRLEAALAVTRHLDREGTIVGRHPLATGPIPMVGGVLGLTAPGRIPEVVRELAAHGALDDGFLEAANRGVQLLVRQRALADELVENL